MVQQQEKSTPGTVRELLVLGREFLERKSLEGARLEVELLVAHALGLRRLEVFLELDRPVRADEIDRARALLVRRAKGEPCAYLTGTREFYARDFEVGPGVLIPRQETELLVDLGRERLADVSEPTVLDVGTGSGCVAVTLALELPAARVTATDISREALAFAVCNAERLLEGPRSVEFLEGDGLEPVRERTFDLVVSNPPYVRPESRDSLAGEVRDFEPPQALFAPAGEPNHWVRLLVRALDILVPGGALLIELGFDQEASVRAWLTERGTQHRIHPDLAGVPRVLEVTRDVL